MPFKDPDVMREYQKEYQRKRRKTEYSHMKKLQDEWRAKNRSPNYKPMGRTHQGRSPWIKLAYSIKRRCTDSTVDSWKYYGGKGIKCRITAEELKTLWFRDKAYEMYQPSIDRRDSDKDYCFENCRFIEWKENCKSRTLCVE